MIEFFDLSQAPLRACCATHAQDNDASWSERDYFAGYCLDAVEEIPAGATRRFDPGPSNPYVREPFATPERAWR